MSQENDNYNLANMLRGANAEVKLLRVEGNKAIMERDELREAIRKAVADFDSIPWGWHVHYGSDKIIEALSDLLPENK